MVIREMSREECLRVLAGTRLARLACARENQPYVVPVYLAYHESCGGTCLYGFTTPGQKVAWMRANPLVCVEVDEVTAHDRWMSVVAFGRYEELPEGTEGEDLRQQAWQALTAQAAWWEPACTAWAARAHRDPAEPWVSVYYKIWIDQVTGHEATRDAREAAPAARSSGWLRRAIRRVFGSKPRHVDAPRSPAS